MRKKTFELKLYSNKWGKLIDRFIYNHITKEIRRLNSKVLTINFKKQQHTNILKKECLSLCLVYLDDLMIVKCVDAHGHMTHEFCIHHYIHITLI